MVPGVHCLMLKKQDAGVFSRTLEPKLLDSHIQLQSDDSRLPRGRGSAVRHECPLGGRRHLDALQE